jgi:hypothetical protein
VEKVLALSTDKAVNPINLYGATKLAAEKLLIQSNAYAGGRNTRIACTRYGNVVGSRGSVVPLFLQQRPGGRLTITDERMTRFWISLEQGVRFVIRCIEQMQGGEVFVPKIPSMNMMDLAKAVAPEAQVDIIGIRPGEKLHETLISEDEARTTVELPDMFVVQPASALWFGRAWEKQGKALPDGFRYSSNTNTDWLDLTRISEMIARLKRTSRRTNWNEETSGNRRERTAGAEPGAQSRRPGWDVTGWSGRRALARVPFNAEQVDLVNPEDIPARVAALSPTWSSTAPRWRILTKLSSTRRWRKS